MKDTTDEMGRTPSQLLRWMLEAAEAQDANPKARMVNLMFSRATLRMWIERVQAAENPQEQLGHCERTSIRNLAAQMREWTPHVALWNVRTLEDMRECKRIIPALNMSAYRDVSAEEMFEALTALRREKKWRIHEAECLSAAQTQLRENARRRAYPLSAQHLGVQKFLQMLARMTDGNMECDDAVATLGKIIARARELLAERL